MHEDFLMKFSADGMIHAVQPMVLDPRGYTRGIHHSDSADDPAVCLTCPYEECKGTAKCYNRRKKELEDKKK